jgi:hypothetical protein
MKWTEESFKSLREHSCYRSMLFYKSHRVFCFQSENNPDKLEYRLGVPKESKYEFLYMICSIGNKADPWGWITVSEGKVNVDAKITVLPDWIVAIIDEIMIVLCELGYKKG